MDIKTATKRDFDSIKVDTAGFYFYPGDCLRDVSALPDPLHAAYFRLLCNHMKFLYYTLDDIRLFCNIDERQSQLLARYLHKTPDGYYLILWAVESIVKYVNYCSSRKKNLKAKPKTKRANKPIQKPIAGTDIEPAIVKINTDNIERLPAYGRIRAYMEGKGHIWDDQKDAPHCRSLVRKLKNYLRVILTSGDDIRLETDEDVFNMFLEIAGSNNWLVKNHFSIETLDKKFTEITTALQNESQEPKKRTKSAKEAGYNIAEILAQ